uniref:IBB domain-containing protein n=1 Tax=Oryza punctata TaxID=4537 RepID=A0A0E0K1S8_ORYPU
MALNVEEKVAGVLGDISNLSVIERRRKRARDKYASMSPEEKERLLQKNREYRQRKKEGVGEINLATSTTITVGTFTEDFKQWKKETYNCHR